MTEPSADLTVKIIGDPSQLLAELNASPYRGPVFPLRGRRTYTTTFTLERYNSRRFARWLGLPFAPPKRKRYPSGYKLPARKRRHWRKAKP